MDDQSKFMDSEDMVTCPYNPAHILTRKRLAIHLLKCKKHHAEVSKEMKRCPYNIQHVIPREEFQYHLQICQDRDNEYLNTYSIGQQFNDNLPDMMKSVSISADTANEENWDEAPKVDVLTNIQFVAKDKVAFNSFSNLPPAERKQLRMEDRRKTREKLNQDEREFERKKMEFTKKSSKRDDTKFSSKRDNDESSTKKYDDDQSSFVSAATQSVASFATDISYKTALTTSAMRLQSFQQVGEKKVLGRGRGRSGLVLPAVPNVKLGIGRSKLLK